MRPILFRRCRSEQDDSSDGDNEVIGAIMKVHGKAVESLTGAWRCVEGQMMMIPTTLCRSMENLHGDIYYFLIGGLMWKTQWRP